MENASKKVLQSHGKTLVCIVCIRDNVWPTVQRTLVDSVLIHIAGTIQQIGIFWCIAVRCSVIFWTCWQTLQTLQYIYIYICVYWLNNCLLLTAAVSSGSRRPSDPHHQSRVQTLQVPWNVSLHHCLLLCLTFPCKSAFRYTTTATAAMYQWCLALGLLCPFCLNCH